MKPKTIAFIGIDGSGKTTLIRRLMKELKNKRIKSVPIYMGLGRNYHTPFLERILEIYSKLKYKKSGLRIKTNPQIKDNYRIRGFFWIMVQYLELWVRYISSLFLDGYVLFDRYFYDGLILSSERNFNFFKKITPAPTKAFLIYAPSAIIVKRKNEASEINVNEFYKRVEKLLKEFEIIKIDNSKPIKTSLKKIMGELI